MIRKSKFYLFFLLVANVVFDVSAMSPQSISTDIKLIDSLSKTELPLLKRCGIDNNELIRLLNLPYDQFDQDFDGGWRAISYKQDCKYAAQRIIELYILFNTDTKHLRGLRWHAGQLAAGLGNSTIAIAFFNASMHNEIEATESQRSWNLYAKGSIAFLNRDKARLRDIRNELATIPVSKKEKLMRQKFLEENPNVIMPNGFLEQPQNLPVLDNLLRCFDPPYDKAYGGDC